MTSPSDRDSTLSRMARERAADREAGRPERGLLTGRREWRGRSRDHADEGLDDADVDEALDDLEGETDHDLVEPPRRETRSRGGRAGRPRTGAKRTVLSAVRNLPSYMRMLFGLMGDDRVSRIDRFFVLAAVAYIVSPLDFIPDLLPLLGQTDDLFLLVLALQRLLDNAGRTVLLDHWRGHPDDISDINLTGILSAASFFLPGRIKRRLRRFSQRGSRRD